MNFARRVRKCLLSQLNPLDFIPWKPSNGMVRSLSQSRVTSSGTDRWNQKTRRHGQLIPSDTNVGFTPRRGSFDGYRSSVLDSQKQNGAFADTNTRSCQDDTVRTSGCNGTQYPSVAPAEGERSLVKERKSTVLLSQSGLFEYLGRDQHKKILQAVQGQNEQAMAA